MIKGCTNDMLIILLLTSSIFSCNRSSPNSNDNNTNNNSHYIDDQYDSISELEFNFSNEKILKNRQGKEIKFHSLVEEKHNIDMPIDIINFFKNTRKKIYDPFTEKKVTISKEKENILNKIKNNFNEEDINNSYKKTSLTKIKLDQSTYTSFLKYEIKNIKILKNLEIKLFNDAFDLSINTRNNVPIIFTNFANKKVGGGCLPYTLTQEEQIFANALATSAISNIITSKPGTFPLSKDEIIIINQLPQFGILDAKQIYGNNYNWKQRCKVALNSLKNLDKVTNIDVLCIDAPQRSSREEKYNQNEIEHIIKKLINSVLSIKRKYIEYSEVIWKFGNWGMGAFQNKFEIPMGIFLIIVSQANAHIEGPIIKVDLHLFKNRKKLGPLKSYINSILKENKTTEKSISKLVQDKG